MSQPELLLPLSASAPNAEAVWTPSGAQTWSELERRARQVAQAIRSEGTNPGDAWGLLANNRIEWAELLVGNARSGARYVPLNWHLTAPEVAELLIDSGSKFLIVDPDNEAVGREAAAVAGLERIIVLGADYDAWVEAQPDAPLPECTAGAPLQYTGGTTGRSKGVLRSDQGGPASDAFAAMYRWGGLVGMPEQGNGLLCTPAYHALGGGLVRGLLARSHTLTILPKWDPVQLLAIIEERNITSTAMVPTQFIRLLKMTEAERSASDVSSIEWVLHTAAPCPPWAKRAMIDWFGPVITELYGSSEGTGPVICSSSEWLERPGTVGRSDFLELSIVDDDGNDLPPGEIGTVYVKRPDGAPKYHGDEAKSDAILLADGRFTVGDVGYLDDAGYLFLADRRVDLILSGGTNVYPAEIEGVLSQHPKLADVAVFGIPHPDWGQEIKAVVEPAPGAEVTADEVIAYAVQHLAKFKVPRSVDIADALPREASGKLKKRLLRDPYWE